MIMKSTTLTTSILLLFCGSPPSFFLSLPSLATAFDHTALVSTRRGAVPPSFMTEFNSSQQDNDNSDDVCIYDGGQVVFSQPLSLEKDDKYYGLASQMLLAAHMTVDAINSWPRCGIMLANKHYSLALQSYGDKSKQNLTAQIGRAIAHEIIEDATTTGTADFLLSGYSSKLTSYLSPVAASQNLTLVTSTASRTSIHEPHKDVYGMFTPAHLRLNDAFFGLRNVAGAQTLSYIVQAGVAGCDGVESMAEKHGIQDLGRFDVHTDAPFEYYVEVAAQMSVLDPDFVVACIREDVGHWNQAQRHVDWTPRGQIYTPVFGTEAIELALGNDVMYQMGVSNWDPALPAIPDAVTGWTPFDFHILFEETALRRPVYQTASGGAVISLYVQALERVNQYRPSNWHALVSEELRKGYFPTYFGNVSFDENGQNLAPFILLQYDENKTPHVQEPQNLKTSSFDIVYPMPTWKNRDCQLESRCIAQHQGASCTVDGMCSCPTPLLSNKLRGKEADCLPPPTVGTSKETILALGVGIPVASIIMVVAVVYLYRLHARNKLDATWQLTEDELNFAEPEAQVIGRGTFGEVLLAEYRGTQVAVKRVLPPSSSSKLRGSSATATLSQELSRETIDTVDTMNPATSSWAFAGITSGGAAGAFARTSLTFGRSSGAGAVFGRSSLTPLEDKAKSRSTLRQEFIQEMRLLSKLRHPCITTVMGAIVDPSKEPMLIMEYMDHGSLYELLHNETMVLEPEMILNMIRDISQGCRFLLMAEPSVIHGDLKSANILVDSKFRAKVADFGLSRKTDVATGTPYWMAPELLRGETGCTHASDVYSFGIILYEVFSRRDPYDGEDAQKVLKMVADTKVNKRPPVPKDCPAQMASLMKDCLVSNPEERPSFEELDKRLKRVEVEATSKASTVSLFDIFPKKIAQALKEGKKVEPEHRDIVTIFFSDIVGFTDMSSSMDPRKVANMLDRLYSKFDKLSDKHDIFKVETIGDAYMAVTNLTKDQPHDHVKRIAEFALDSIQAANQTLVDEDDPQKGYVNIRAGFHSGPVVADVVGARNPRYCLFGDTVNTASRMESNSKKNRIMCSKISADLLKKQYSTVSIYPRGRIQVKGKGRMDTYWIGANQIIERANQIIESSVSSPEEPPLPRPYNATTKHSCPDVSQQRPEGGNQFTDELSI